MVTEVLGTLPQYPYNIAKLLYASLPTDRDICTSERKEKISH